MILEYNNTNPRQKCRELKIKFSLLQQNALFSIKRAWMVAKRGVKMQFSVKPLFVRRCIRANCLQTPKHVTFCVFTRPKRKRVRTTDVVRHWAHPEDRWRHEAGCRRGRETAPGRRGFPVSDRKHRTQELWCPGSSPEKKFLDVVIHPRLAVY